MRGVFADSPIPNGKNVETEETFKQAYFSWWKKQVLEPYKTRHENKLDKLAPQLKFLEEYCLHKAKLPSSLSLDELIKSGVPFVEIKKMAADPMMDFNNQVEKNMPDAIFAACVGDLKTKSFDSSDKKRYETVKSMLLYAVNELSSQGYPTAIREAVNEDMAEAVYRTGNWSQAKEYSDRAETLVAETIDPKNLPDKYGDRIAYQFVFRDIWINWLSILKSIRRRASHMSPWMTAMFDGYFLHKRAWKARGGGWAGSVSKDGWKNFKKYGTAAGELFRKAWVIHPEYPEAPAKLISTAMAGHTRPGEDEEFWFNQSVKAQMDYHTAYSNYFWALRPRWGGSHAAMLNLGIRAYNTKRFDTNVPRYLLHALLNIADESRLLEKRKIFRGPGIKHMIDEIYTNMLVREDLASAERNKLTLEYSYCKAWMGDYDKAKELFDKTTDSVKTSSLFFGEGDAMIGWRKSFAGELAAFTGPSGSVARKWEEAILNGNSSGAMRLQEQLLDPAKTDLATRRVIMDRLAMIQLGYIPKGCPVLSVVISQRKKELALTMIERGADINEKDDDGWTPLLYALRYDMPEIAETLIAKGGKVRIASNEGWSPLHYAVRYSIPSIVTVLLDKGAEINATTNALRTPLALAPFNKKHGVEIAKLLIARKASLDKGDDGGFTPLHRALNKKRYAIVRLLVEAGADIHNAKNHLGNTPLLYAIKKKCGLEIISYLIDHGANVNFKNKDMHNALDYDIFYHDRKIELAETLLKHKIELNKRDYGGGTPLHNAVHKKCLAMVKWLLDHGADKTIKNNAGKTPLEVARMEKIKALLR
ncbi:MAG: hypothetical protein GXP32_10480 [Kiritimatiellaeota bacterium]|nr:hypothetical protein [Kiritimatiellota bacterium]